uniref:Uncharacterized protein n=1 Tax=Pithovirus LCPAC404 TaxID=2506597 RepID=A0A481ZBQ9_9VIRU|nr:MAG: hypothetical protein LCPAC404_00770 [Pithovirus LCPAC404]
MIYGKNNRVTVSDAKIHISVDDQEGTLFFNNVYSKVKLITNMGKMIIEEKSDIDLFKTIMSQSNIVSFIGRQNKLAKKEIDVLKAIDYVRILLEIDAIQVSIPEIAAFLNEWYIALWQGSNVNERAKKCRELGDEIVAWVSSDIHRFNHVAIHFNLLIQNLTCCSLDFYKEVALKICPEASMFEEIYDLVRGLNDNMPSTLRERHVERRRRLFIIDRCIKKVKDWTDMKPIIHLPDKLPDDYTVFVGSHNHKLVNKLRKKIPHIVHLDGAMYPSFSRLVNDCIRACSTEIFIFASDRMDISQKDIDKTVNLINDGYAFVALNSYRFFGFKKELIRHIGFFDERFIAGGYEDNDFSVRIVEARLPYYVSEELTCDTNFGSRWSYNIARTFWTEKWSTAGGKITRKIPDIPYDGSLGEPSNDKWYNPLTPIWAVDVDKVPKMKIKCMDKHGHYVDNLDEYILSIRPEFRNMKTLPEKWNELLNFIESTLCIDSPPDFVVGEKCDPPRLEYTEAFEDGNIYSCVVIDGYKPYSDTVKFFEKLRKNVEIGGYVIIRGRVDSDISSNNMFSVNYQGQIYLAAEYIKNKYNKMFDVMLCPVHPGLCLLRRRA